MCYLLFIKSNSGLQVQPNDLSYFGEHFLGERIEADWRPPGYEIIRPKQSVRHFVSWMLQAPLVSEHAKSILEPITGDTVQYVFFDVIKNTPLYVMNVALTLPNMPETEPPILFRLEHDKGVIFANQVFVDVVIKHRLHGAGFATDLDLPKYLIDPLLNDVDHWIH